MDERGLVNMNEVKSITYLDLMGVLENTISTLKNRIDNTDRHEILYKKYEKGLEKYSILLDCINHRCKNAVYAIHLTNKSEVFADIPDITLYYKIDSPTFYVGEEHEITNTSVSNIKLVMKEYDLPKDYSLYGKIQYSDEFKTCFLTNTSSMKTMDDMLLLYNDGIAVTANHIPKISDYRNWIYFMFNKNPLIKINSNKIVDIRDVYSANYFNEQVMRSQILLLNCYNSIYTNCATIFDRMDSTYADNESLVEGLKDGVMYDHVSTTYLNGYINYVNIILGCMVRRYMSPFEWNDAVDRIDKKNDFHTSLEDSDNYDDILILAESGDYYIIFWSNCDNSDSSIGKLRKSNYSSTSNAIAAFNASIVKDISYQVEEITSENFDDNIKYIPPTFFSGWITL